MLLIMLASKEHKVDDDWLIFWGLLPNEAQKNMLKH
jgi:hypothetical protein